MATLEAPRPLEALAARVAGAAHALGDDERTALTLREREGATYADIAGALGRDAAAVPDLLVAARLAVREAVRGAAEPPRTTPYCGDARRLLCLRQDGEPLSPPEVEWLRGHVDHCGGCREARRALREATLACRAWDRAPLVLAPAAPAVSARQGRAARSRAPRRRGEAVMTAGAVAATVAVVGAATLASDDSPPARDAVRPAAATAPPVPTTSGRTAAGARRLAELRRRDALAARRRREEAVSARRAAEAESRSVRQAALQEASADHPATASAPAPAPARTAPPASAPKPDVIPGDGDTFCVEGDANCP